MVTVFRELEISLKFISPFPFQDKADNFVIDNYREIQPLNDREIRLYSSVDSEIPEDTAEPEVEEANEARVINFV